MSKKDKTTVSLVLGSGGARGLAHIGVIHWLEENNFEIKSISSCSIGAIIGGVYAAGKLDEFEEWARAITKIDIVKLLDVAWKSNGLVKGERIINSIKDVVGDAKIEDLPMKYTAVAADILNEKEIWISSGSLFDAIRASMSLPLFFTPFEYKGIDLIDGGVLNPVPIAPTFNDDTDITIAVNLGGERDDTISKNVDKKKIKQSSSIITDKIVSFIESLSDSSDERADDEWGAYDIANLAFDAMQNTIARQKLAAYPPDNFIEIASNACGILDFDMADDMIYLGYKKAQASLAKLVD